MIAPTYIRWKIPALVLVSVVMAAGVVLPVRYYSDNSGVNNAALHACLMFDCRGYHDS